MRKILIFSLILLAPLFAQAQTCPFGLENDPAPGSCTRFIDENQNDLCDLSEVPLDVKTTASDEVKYVSGEELKQYSVSQVAEMYGIKASDYAVALSAQTKKTIKTTDTLQFLHDEYGLCSGVAGSIALDLKNKANTTVANREANGGPQNQAENNEGATKVLVITLAILGLYSLTYFLYKQGKITLFTHRFIWNGILLVSFLVCGLSGLLLAARLNFGFGRAIGELHENSGILMTIIALLHAIWHWQYYLCIFKNKDKCPKEN